MYKKTINPDIIHNIENNAFFKPASDTFEAKKYSAWLALGNSPDEFSEELNDTALIENPLVAYMGLKISDVPTAEIIQIMAEKLGLSDENGNIKINL